MNEPVHVPFTYGDREVRSVLIDGEPWFVAADIIAILGLGNITEALRGLDDDEFRTTEVVDSAGRRQQSYIVNEPGLYSLILRSRRTEAKAFKRWLTHDVIPQIRKTGKYAGAEQIEYQIPQTYAAALELAALQAKELEARELELAAAAPKVQAYDALMDAEGFYSMEAAAKVLGLGRNTLFRKLRDIGVLQHGSNLPYQRHMHHFTITASSWEDPEGVTHLTHTTRVRPSGLDYLRRRLAAPVEVAS